MNSNKLKGTFSVLEQVIILVAAIALCSLLLSLVFNLWPTETTGSKGTPKQVSNFLVDQVDECLKRHNYGLDPKSALCGDFEIEADDTITENMILEEIDCSKTPIDNCVDISITKNKTFVSVRYIASTRQVTVEEFGCFSEDDCSDGDNCTEDICRFPGTTDSACSWKYVCTDNTEVTCVEDTDCYTAQCCHPVTCTTEDNIPECSSEECTEECQEGTMDCGAGQCVCQEGACVVEWN